MKKKGTKDEEEELSSTTIQFQKYRTNKTKSIRQTKQLGQAIRKGPNS